MKSYGNAIRFLLVVLMVVGIGSVLVSAKEENSLSDGDECVLYTADGYLEDEADDTEGDEANEAEDDDDAGEDADEEGDVDESDDDDTGGSGEDDANETDEEGAEDEANEDEDEAAIVGSITVDETALDSLTPEARCDALTAQATISLEEAQAAAEAETGAVVAQVELDVENGFLVYSIDMEDGTGVTVDAGNGAVVATEAAGADESEDEADEDDASAPANTGITADEAQAIAEAETGGTTREVEFEVERGVEIWEVEMQDGTEVQINASDGTIILIEEDDN